MLLIMAAAVAVDNPALIAYVHCLADRAEQLDDGRSDPQSVGRVLIQQCRRQLELLADETMKGEKHAAQKRRYYMEYAASGEDGFAAMVVLKQRRDRASASSPRR